MADNIVLNSGSGGATLATDELPGSLAHVQYVKLMNGTADSSAVITGDATNGLDVDVTRLPADAAVTGSITAAGQTVAINNDRGEAVVGIQLSGAWVATIEFEGTVDGTNWVALRVSDGSSLVTSTTANGVFLAPAGHLDQVRVRASAFTSGTVAVNLKACRGSVASALITQLPAGTNNIGDVDIASALPAGSNLIGKVQLRNPGNTADLGDATNPIRIDPTGTTTQPVSGTVTANAGTGTFVVDQVEAASLDYDTGAGTVLQTVMGIALPGAGGPVAGGTSANPVRIDPTGTTAQPVTDNAASLTVDAPVGTPVAVRPSDGAAFYELPQRQVRETTVNPGVTVMAELDDTATVVPAEGQASPLRITAQRGLHVNLRASGGGEIGTATAPIRVDPTGTTTQPVSGTVTANAGTGTFTVDQVDTASLDYDTGAGTVLQTIVGIALPGNGGPVAGGTSSAPIRIDPVGTTTQPISGNVGLNAGNNNIGDVDIASFAAGAITEVQGDVAHGAAAAGNPVLVGGRASQSGPAAVSNDSATYAWMDQQGRRVTVLNFPANPAADDTRGPKRVNATASGDTTVLAAPTAGNSIYVTSVMVSNQATAKNRVLLKEGAAGAARCGGTAAADGGGFVFPFNPPWKLPAATALVVNLGGAGDIDVTVHYFVAP